MDVKISEGKLEFLIETIIAGIGVDVNHLSHNFQTRMSYLEFLASITTRREMIAKYDFEWNYIIVFDDKFYDLVKSWISYKVYDLIKEELIKRIFKIYTGKYKSIYKDEPKSIKFVDEFYNKV